MLFVGSLQTDGRIKSLEMHGIQKRYSPEKHYVSRVSAALQLYVLLIVGVNGGGDEFVASLTLFCCLFVDTWSAFHYRLHKAG